MSLSKIAVFSDIHSNYHAFRACFEDAVALGVDSFVFLGDYVSDLAEPEKVLDLLYDIRSKYPTFCLLGNRERYMLECKNGECTFAPGSKSGSLLFTFSHLRPKDFAFFESLKMSDTIVIDGIPIEIAHAAMDDDRCYFEKGDAQIQKIFQNMHSDYLLTGHSHRQYIQHHTGKTIINPGSVGIPQDGTIWPKYAVLKISNGSVSCCLQQVHYDLRDAIRSQFRSGLVDIARFWAIGVLYDIITGKECVLSLLKTVQDNGDVSDEAQWQLAAAQLGMAETEQELIRFYANQHIPFD